MSSKLIYYVYAYLREDNTPYYIGKGKGNRAFSLDHTVGVPPTSRIVFLERNLTNTGALAIERRLIRWYGRKDIGTGILRNRTDGGEGGSGRVLSQHTKDKISAKLAGKTKPPRTAEHAAHIALSLKGHTKKARSVEHCKKISDRMKGTKMSPEAIAKREETKRKNGTSGSKKRSLQ